MKTLIIYYSNEGTTEIVAKTIARQIGCYLCQVKDLKKRKKNKILIITTRV